MRNPYTQQRKKNTLIFPNTKKNNLNIKLKSEKYYIAPRSVINSLLFFFVCTRTFMIVFDHHHHHLVAHLSEGVCTRARKSSPRRYQHNKRDEMANRICFY